MSSIVSETLPETAEHSSSTWPLTAWPGASATAPSRRHAAPQLFLAPSGLEIRLPIRGMDDLVKARRSGRLLANQLGCSGSRVALVMTAISELSRNILSYAGSGEIVLSRTRMNGQQGVVVTASDDGPGIEDVANLLDEVDSNPTQGQSARGLKCLKACMDRFHIASSPGAGTRVTCEIFATRTS